MEGYGGLEKWGDPSHGGYEENEETLSLSDLPMSATATATATATNGDDQKNTENRSENEQDFYFTSLCGSLLTEAEMCAADQVFFQGQILPLRLSVSSESGLQGIQHECRNLSSRSESMDHSHSSRSNSTGSHNSTTITTTTTSTTPCTYKPKLRNRFHSHPSPKPQISSTPRPGSATKRSRKSTIWGIFKVGVARTPEIELHALKLRHNNSNKKLNSTNSSSSSSRKSDAEIKSQEKKKKKNMKRFLLEECKCSVDAVETIIIRKNKKSTNGKENKQIVKEKEEIKQKKQALYHTRTFEWLKELSIADVPDVL